MKEAGWADVWHLVTSIVARQEPFAQIMLVTGAVFVAVMAVEGVRASLLAIWRGHRVPPSLDAPASSEPLSLAAAPETPAGKSFSVRSGPRAAATTARKRKPLTVGARQFRSPRPKIRRHPVLDLAAANELPVYTADGATYRPEGV